MGSGSVEGLNTDVTTGTTQELVSSLGVYLNASSSMNRRPLSGKPMVASNSDGVDISTVVVTTNNLQGAGSSVLGLANKSPWRLSRQCSVHIGLHSRMDMTKRSHTWCDR